MELEHLKEYIEFMNEHNLCEIEIEEEGKRIKLKRSSSDGAVVIAPGNPGPAAAASQEQRMQTKETQIEIKSPMVGTFYRAPSPGAKNYVEIGDRIKPGDILCIIEAMKLMNEIKAELGGKLTQIPVENGEPVEFGQALFLIEPD